MQTHTKTAQEAGSGCRSQQRLGTPTSAGKVCNGGGSRQRLGKLATIGEAGAGWGSRQRLGNRRWLGKLAMAREAGTWWGLFQNWCVSNCGVLEWGVSQKTMSRNMVSRDFDTLVARSRHLLLFMCICRPQSVSVHAWQPDTRQQQRLIGSPELQVNSFTRM